MKTTSLEIPIWGWLAFAGLVVILLAVDHFAHRGEHGRSRRTALTWSMIWIGAGLGFNGFVLFVLGTQAPANILRPM